MATSTARDRNCQGPDDQPPDRSDDPTATIDGAPLLRIWDGDPMEAVSDCAGWSTKTAAAEFRVGRKASGSSVLDASASACDLATANSFLLGTLPDFY